MQHDRVKYQQGIMNELQDNSKIVLGQSEEEKLEKKIQKKIENNEAKTMENKENKDNKDENENKSSN